MKTLWFDPMRPLGALGTEPRKRRSPKGQNSPEAVLGNPSFSAKTKKRAYWGPFLVLMGWVVSSSPTVAYSSSVMASFPKIRIIKTRL